MTATTKVTRKDERIAQIADDFFYELNKTYFDEGFAENPPAYVPADQFRMEMTEQYRRFLQEVVDKVNSMVDDEADNQGEAWEL